VKNAVADELGRANAFASSSLEFALMICGKAFIAVSAGSLEGTERTSICARMRRRSEHKLAGSQPRVRLFYRMRY
jgi:hypothetical protein